MTALNIYNIFIITLILIYKIYNYQIINEFQPDYLQNIQHIDLFILKLI